MSGRGRSGKCDASPSRKTLQENLPDACQESAPSGEHGGTPPGTTVHPFPTAKIDWEAAVDALSQLVVVLDANGRVMRASRALERLHLGVVSDVKGHDLHGLLHPGCEDTRCYLLGLWTEAQAPLAEQGVWAREVEDTVLSRRLALEMRPIATVGHESAAGIVMLLRDVTEQRETEGRLRHGHALLEQQVSARTRDLLYTNSRLRQAVERYRETEGDLRKSEECYRRLVDTMLEGMVVFDTNGIILYANESLCRMFGFERAIVVGEHIERIFPGIRRSAPPGECDPSVPGSCRRYEAEWGHQDGHMVAAHVSTQRLEGPAGEYLGDFAVMMDITDRKRSERANRMLSAQLLGAEETERKRIADELHDSLGQTLGALKFQVEHVALDAGTSDGHAISGLLGGLVPKIQLAIDEVRRIAMDLRPSMLDDLGVLPTLGWFCREFQKVYPGVELDLALDIREQDVPEGLTTAIYRIVQEAMSNIARHAQAKRARVALQHRDGTVTLRIEDDGDGFDIGRGSISVSDHCGLGLRTMRERAESTGGSFRMESERGKGTRLFINWSSRIDKR